MLAVTVEFELDPNCVEQFRQAVLAQAKNSLEKESACQQFDVCLDNDNPNLVFLYELYDDETAFKQHLDTDHFADFTATVQDWVVGKSVRTWIRLSS